MFDLREALQPLVGRTFDGRELREEFLKLWLQNHQALPPDYGARDLLELAQERQWIVEDSGRLRVELR